MISKLGFYALLAVFLLAFLPGLILGLLLWGFLVGFLGSGAALLVLAVGLIQILLMRLKEY